jgi:alpha-beta hydrolase superfamily lysophospholipase
MVGATDKTLKLYEGGFHDLLNDIDKKLVMQDIEGWINIRLPAILSTPLLTEAAKR